MDALFVAALVAFSQVDHYFQHQEIGAGHDVAGAAGAQAVEKFFQDFEMELHGLPGGQAGIDQEFGQAFQFVAQIAGTHDHIGPQ